MSMKDELDAVLALVDETEESCCGRRECGGECGGHYSGTVPTAEALYASLSFLRTHGARLRAAVEDVERIDWMESQFADGVHVEGCYSGSWGADNLQRRATVFYGNKEERDVTIRAAIDAARASENKTP